MLDLRILSYTQATEQMRKGTFPVVVPVEGGDELARLGQSLNDLGVNLERKFEEMHALLRVTSDINAGLVLDDILEHLYQRFDSLLPYERIGVALLEPHEHGTRVRARWAKTQDNSRLLLTQGYSAALQGSSLEPLITTGKPRIINDLKDYLKSHPDSVSTRMVVQEGIRSNLTCPLIAQGKPLGFIFFSSVEPGTYTDVHVELYQQIAGQLATTLEKGRLYEELLELSQLKSRFLGMAAHDLRNPIGVVTGYLDILLSGMTGELNSQQRQALSRAEHASQQMLRLVNDFLDISKIESGAIELSPQQVKVVPFLKDVLEANQLPAQSKQISLSIEDNPELGENLFDPQRIEQVLGNLISNALKFSNPNTHIRLAAHYQGNALEIRVTDQGQGISEAEQSLLFKDFSRTSTVSTAGEKSTGLGLAICKRIIQAHGGTIGVESRPGEGSTFYFRLPLQDN